MGRAAKSCSIIGGADGPTSIFIAGRKESNILKRIQSNILNKKYKRRTERAKKSIIPGAHTMEEVILYMRQHYDAVEAEATYSYYNERKRSMKFSLIQRIKPELLGEDQRFLPPEDIHDEEAVKIWCKQLDNWVRIREQRADAIPDGVFPTDYHLFIINKGEQGKLEIEIDTYYLTISMSYSGDKKVMEPISKDIHLYYGVSQEDIDTKSDRYQTLLAVLSSW